MGNLEMGLELDLDLKLNAGFLHHCLKREYHYLDFGLSLIQTYCLHAGIAAAVGVLKVCILLEPLSHRRNLLVSEVLHWQCSYCLDLWKETDSVG